MLSRPLVIFYDLSGRNHQLPTQCYAPPVYSYKTPYGLHLPRDLRPAESVCTFGANDSRPERPPERRT